MQRNRALGGERLLDALLWDVEAFSGSADPADDISAVLFEWRGSEQR